MKWRLSFLRQLWQLHMHTPSGSEIVDRVCIPTWNRLEWRPRSVCGVEPTPQLHVDSRSRPWLCRLHQFALNLPETNNCHRAVTHCLQSTGSLPAHSLVLLVELAVLFFFSFSKSVSSFTLIPFFLHLTVSFCFSKFLIFAELKKEIKRSAIPRK